MARPSTVKRLPAPVRDAIHRLIDGGQTIDEIVAHLDTLGHDVSRSAMGRYKQRYERIGARVREAQAAAEAIAKQVGSKPDEDISLGLLQLAQVVAFRLAERRADDDEADDMEELMQLCRSIKDLTAARKGNVDIEKAIRQRVAEEAAAAAGEAATAAGLTAELADEIRRKVLGVRTAAA